MRSFDSRLIALNKRVDKINPMNQPGWDKRVAEAYPESEAKWERLFEIARQEGIENLEAISRAYSEGHPEIKPLLDEITECMCAWAEKLEPRLDFRGQMKDIWSQR